MPPNKIRIYITFTFYLYTIGTIIRLNYRQNGVSTVTAWSVKSGSTVSDGQSYAPEKSESRAGELRRTKN